MDEHARMQELDSQFDDEIKTTNGKEIEAEHNGVIFLKILNIGLPVSPPQEFCEWVYDKKTELWGTNCGRFSDLKDENTCFHCGKPIKVINNKEE